MLAEVRDYIYKIASQFMKFSEVYGSCRRSGMTREEAREKANYDARLFRE